MATGGLAPIEADGLRHPKRRQGRAQHACSGSACCGSDVLWRRIQPCGYPEIHRWIKTSSTCSGGGIVQPGMVVFIAPCCWLVTSHTLADPPAHLRLDQDGFFCAAGCFDEPCPSHDAYCCNPNDPEGSCAIITDDDGTFQVCMDVQYRVESHSQEWYCGGDFGTVAIDAPLQTGESGCLPGASGCEAQVHANPRWEPGPASPFWLCCDDPYGWVDGLADSYLNSTANDNEVRLEGLCNFGIDCNVRQDSALAILAVSYRVALNVRTGAETFSEFSAGVSNELARHCQNGTSFSYTLQAAPCGGRWILDITANVDIHWYDGTTDMSCDRPLHVTATVLIHHEFTVPGMITGGTCIDPLPDDCVSGLPRKPRKDGVAGGVTPARPPRPAGSFI